MKQLNFKKKFEGLGDTLGLIPESYKTDKNTFIMTDGDEKYTVRWEGSLQEGKAVIVNASNKSLINEDISKMKHLMNYKSQETLGQVKGSERVDENAKFGDILTKTKNLLKENE